MYGQCTAVYSGMHAQRDRVGPLRIRVNEKQDCTQTNIGLRHEEHHGWEGLRGKGREFRRGPRARARHAADKQSAMDTKQYRVYGFIKVKPAVRSEVPTPPAPLCVPPDARSDDSGVCAPMLWRTHRTLTWRAYGRMRMIAPLQWQAQEYTSVHHGRGHAPRVHNASTHVQHPSNLWARHRAATNASGRETPSHASKRPPAKERESSGPRGHRTDADRFLHQFEGDLDRNQADDDHLQTMGVADLQLRGERIQEVVDDVQALVQYAHALLDVQVSVDPAVRRWSECAV